MKTKLKFGGIDFELDCENNKRIYSGLTSDTESFEHDEIIKFYLSKRDTFFSNELIEFLKLTGIEWTKENECLHYSVDNVVIVEGWYDIIGNILTAKRVAFNCESNFCTINIFLGNEFRHGIRNELQNFETFRLDFSIVIPKEVLSESSKGTD